MRIAFSASFLIVGTLLACKLGSTPVASCDVRKDPADEFCFDYPSGEMAAGEKACKEFGTWSPEKICDRASALGSCKLVSGLTKWYYPGTKPKTAAMAKLECEEGKGNTWVEK